MMSSWRRTPSSVTSKWNDPPDSRLTRSVKPALNDALPSILKSILQREPSSLIVVFSHPLLLLIEVEALSISPAQPCRNDELGAGAAWAPPASTRAKTIGARRAMRGMFMVSLLWIRAHS